MKRFIRVFSLALALFVAGDIPVTVAATGQGAQPGNRSEMGPSAVAQQAGEPVFTRLSPPPQSGVPAGTVNISFTATAATPLTDFTIAVDGLPRTTRTTGAGTTTATTTATVALAVAPHKVVATVTDSVGRTSTANWAFVATGNTASIRCFAETAHCIAFGFKAFWEANGGLAIFGFPITEEFLEQNQPPPFGDGRVHTVQYFERQRFEFHPENPPGSQVLGGLLGRQVAEINGELGLPAFQPAARNTNPNCTFFPETRQNSCFSFRNFWQTRGGLRVFGFPISGDFSERNPPPPLGDGQVHVVQYYERARFEFHPENPPASRVLLGLLGRVIVPSGRTVLDP